MTVGGPRMARALRAALNWAHHRIERKRGNMLVRCDPPREAPAAQDIFIRKRRRGRGRRHAQFKEKTRGNGCTWRRWFGGLRSMDAQFPCFPPFPSAGWTKRFTTHKQTGDALGALVLWELGGGGSRGGCCRPVDSAGRRRAQLPRTQPPLRGDDQGHFGPLLSRRCVRLPWRSLVRLQRHGLPTPRPQPFGPPPTQDARTDRHTERKTPSPRTTMLACRSTVLLAIAAAAPAALAWVVPYTCPTNDLLKLGTTKTWTTTGKVWPRAIPVEGSSSFVYFPDGCGAGGTYGRACLARYSWTCPAESDRRTRSSARRQPLRRA